MGVRENKVEKYLDEQVKNIGGITRKWISPGHDGVPDRIVITPMTVADKIAQLQKLHPDTVMAEINLVEVKVKGGELSPVQIREHIRLNKVGIDVNTVHGEAGVDYSISLL